MRRIYIAAPYTHGDVAQNVHQAIEAADALLRHGFAPYVPHLHHLWHLVSPHTYAEWLLLDFAWLSQCDAILRLPGMSAGADQEVMWAEEHDMPVYTCMDALIQASHATSSPRVPTQE